MIALLGHIPRAHPQHAALRDDPRAGILCMGPQGYVSPLLVSNPTWGPTWNYAMCRFETDVHFVPDETDAARSLPRPSRDSRPTARSPGRMGARYEQLKERIIAFRAVVRETHARFKLGQDENDQTFGEIVDGLQDRELAEWMGGPGRDVRPFSASARPAPAWAQSPITVAIAGRNRKMASSGRLFIRKPLEHVRADAERHGMVRALGPIQLVMIGIGCIIGAGVYVMTGTAASNYAGPAVVISFALAGLACGFTALCYAELSSVSLLPVRLTPTLTRRLGRSLPGCSRGCCPYKFGLAGSALAVGVAGYLLSLLGDFGIHLPASISTPTVQAVAGEHGAHFMIGSSFNLVAVAAVALFAAVLVRGVTHSARLNAVMVFVKVGVLIAFVIIGAPYVHNANWHPFLPPSQGGFAFGWRGFSGPPPFSFSLI